MSKKHAEPNWFVGLLSVVVLMASILVTVGFIGTDVSKFRLNSKAYSARPRVKVAKNVNVYENGKNTVVNNILVSGDTNWPLRGENPRLFRLWDYEPTNDSFWRKLRDNFNLNTVRVLVYREPQFFNSTACQWNCVGRFNEYYSASDADANRDLQLSVQEVETYKSNIMNAVTARLDEWVSGAERNGFYIIIDYHPVGGYEEFDAREWWKIVAGRYQAKTHVIYEITNEPVSWESSKYFWCNDNSLYDAATCANKRTDGRIRDYKYKTPIDWQASLYNQVRNAAPKTHLILWSFPNASGDLLAVADAGRSKGIAYKNVDGEPDSVGIHIYGTSAYRIGLLKERYPVFASEMGGSDTAEYDGKVSFVEGIGVKGWILLDGTYPGKEATVKWGKDPYFGSVNPAPSAAPTLAPTRVPLPSPTRTPSVTVVPTGLIVSPTSVMPTGVSPTGVVSQFLKNSSFESDPRVDYWSLTDFSDTTKISFPWAGGGYDGVKSLGISASGVNSTTMSRWLTKHDSTRSFAAEPGKTYRGTVWVKTLDVTGNANLNLIFFGPGIYDYVGARPSVLKKGTGDWSQLVAEGVAPANSKYVRFEMRLIGNGTAWFDQATLVKVN